MRHNDDGVFGLRTSFTCLSIAYVAIGVIMLIVSSVPGSVTLSLICYVLGILLTIVGVVAGILYFLRKSYRRKNRYGFILGLSCFLIGFYALCNNADFTNFFFMFIALCMLADSVIKMQFSMELLRVRSRKWWIVLSAGVITILLAMVVLINPFGTNTSSRDIYTYIVLIVDGVINLVTMIYVSLTAQRGQDESSSDQLSVM